VGAREDVRNFNEQFSEALANQDVETVVDAYTEDARIFLPGLPPVRGRAAISALFRTSLAAGPSHMSFATDELWDCGDVVIDVGTYTSGGDTGKYVVVHERQPDGSLKMAVDAPSRDV
jgi:ketosteroid isomerase-like protein